VNFHHSSERYLQTYRDAHRKHYAMASVGAFATLIALALTLFWLAVTHPGPK
jgi:hypothetical protein